MTKVAAGDGMGTSCLVGEVTTYITMAPTIGGTTVIIYMALIHFLLPAAVALGVDQVRRKAGFVKNGYMKIDNIK